MKYGLLVYWNKVINIGEYIQSLSAQKFLPQTDYYINKEKLSKFDCENIALILNGWFMHYPENWPPSDMINPLFISFHISEKAKKKLISSEAIDYYKKHEPIGCRDCATEELLKSKGVEAYFSGCLTLTLDKKDYMDNTFDEDILLVDVLYNMAKYNPRINFISVCRSVLRTPKVLYQAVRKYFILKKLLPEYIRKSGKKITQEKNLSKYSHDERFEIAVDFLKKLANAKFVITSRLHTALPCLAFGTPVIFIDGSLDHARDSNRLKTYTSKMLNTITLDQIRKMKKEELHKQLEVFLNGNPEKYKKYRLELEKTVSDFIFECQK